jgi:hypothetical protein
MAAWNIKKRSGCGRFSETARYAAVARVSAIRRKLSAEVHAKLRIPAIKKAMMMAGCCEPDEIPTTARQSFEA